MCTYFNMQIVFIFVIIAVLALISTNAHKIQRPQSGYAVRVALCAGQVFAGAGNLWL
jgi:hypothetical protein